MKTIKLKQKQAPDHQVPASTVKTPDNQDTRYDYLMLLTNDWIASQKNGDYFIRSIN